MRPPQFAPTFILVALLSTSSASVFSDNSSAVDPRKFDSCDVNQVCYVAGSCRVMDDGDAQLIRVQKGKKVYDGCVLGLIAKPYKKDVAIVHFWSLAGNANTTQVTLTLGNNKPIECSTMVGNAFLCQTEVSTDSSAAGIQFRSGPYTSTSPESLTDSLHDLPQQCIVGEIERWENCNTLSEGQCEKPTIDKDALRVSCVKEYGQLEILQDNKWILADAFSCVKDQWTFEENGIPINVTSPKLRCSKTADGPASPKPSIQSSPVAYATSAAAQSDNLGATDGMNYTLAVVLPLLILRG